MPTRKKPLEIVTSMAGTISSAYYQPNLGGDMAAIRGMVKTLLEVQRERLAAGEPGIFDQEFIDANTHGIESYLVWRLKALVRKSMRC